MHVANLPFLRSLRCTPPLPTAIAVKLLPLCTVHGRTDLYVVNKDQLRVMCEGAAESMYHADFSWVAGAVCCTICR